MQKLKTQIQKFKYTLSRHDEMPDEDLRFEKPRTKEEQEEDLKRVKID